MSNETTVGERLRSERARLGYNIRDFAEIGGVSSTAQSNYENDKTSPKSDYLNRISAKGAEIFWIMSGSEEDDEVREKRNAPYTPEIRAFIDDYLLCPETLRESFRDSAKKVADKARLEIKEWNKKQREKKK